MTISRTKSPPWGVGDKLTSAQANAIDSALEYALDKRSGQTDTLESVVACGGAGRVRASIKTGANANTTYAMADAIGIIYADTSISADRTYSLSHTGAVYGDEVTVFCDPAFAHAIAVWDTSPVARLITLGNGEAHEGRWATFFYTGSAWAMRCAGLREAPTATTFVHGTGAAQPYIVPLGCYFLHAHIMGGGGGGGGGGAPAPATMYGGGGGGGALLHSVLLAVTPGETISVIVAAGGEGAAVNGDPSIAEDGANGGTSEILRSATVLARGLGAMGGAGSKYTSAGNYAPGGAPVQSVGGGLREIQTTAPGSADMPLLPGMGGWGVSSASLGYGVGQACAGGAYGASDGATRQGGGGGGGSGWAAGSAGDGGAGSATLDGGSGTNGAYGGGGGGGGAGSDAAGGEGGHGGDGIVVIVPLRT